MRLCLYQIFYCGDLLFIQHQWNGGACDRDRTTCLWCVCVCVCLQSKCACVPPSVSLQLCRLRYVHGARLHGGVRDRCTAIHADCLRLSQPEERCTADQHLPRLRNDGPAVAHHRPPCRHEVHCCSHVCVANLQRHGLRDGQSRVERLPQVFCHVQHLSDAVGALVVAASPADWVRVIVEHRPRSTGHLTQKALLPHRVRAWTC